MTPRATTWASLSVLARPLSPTHSAADLVPVHTGDANVAAEADDIAETQVGQDRHLAGEADPDADALIAHQPIDLRSPHLSQSAPFTL